MLTNDYAEVFQYNVESNAPVEIKDTSRDNHVVDEHERKMKDISDAKDKVLWELGLARGYVGPIYDAQEEEVQKVKDRHIKERERRKEQSGKWVPYLSRTSQL